MQDQAEGLGASIGTRLAGAWMVDSEWSSPVDGGFRAVVAGRRRALPSGAPASTGLRSWCPAGFSG